MNRFKALFAVATAWLSAKWVALTTWLHTRSPRMTLPNLIATGLLLVVVSVAPHQAPVLTYKLALILLAACACYILDVSLFPYAKPSGYLAQPWRDDISFKPSTADFSVAAGCQVVALRWTECEVDQEATGEDTGQAH